MITMREQVARAIHDVTWIDPYDHVSQVEQAMALQQADAAITACLTALAVEAKRLGVDDVTFIQSSHVVPFADFIQPFLPSQPEVPTNGEG